MNVPVVIMDNPDICEKIRIARKYLKVIDGHAPGLRGKDLEIHIKAGISTEIVNGNAVSEQSSLVQHCKPLI